MKYIYAMRGAPGSGKSHFAATHFEPFMPVISRDAIRMQIIKPDEEYFSHENEVFNRLIQSVVDELENHDAVCVDASHLHKWSRRKLVNALSRYLNDFKVVWVLIDTPYEECCKRNDYRSGRANVPHDVIKEMYDSIDAVKSNEPHYGGEWIVRNYDDLVYE